MNNSISGKVVEPESVKTESLIVEPESVKTESLIVEPESVKTPENTKTDLTDLYLFGAGLAAFLLLSRRG